MNAHSIFKNLFITTETSPYTTVVISPTEVVTSYLQATQLIFHISQATYNTEQKYLLELPVVQNRSKDIHIHECLKQGYIIMYNTGGHVYVNQILMLRIHHGIKK